MCLPPRLSRTSRRGSGWINLVFVLKEEVWWGTGLGEGERLTSSRLRDNYIPVSHKQACLCKRFIRFISTVAKLFRGIKITICENSFWRTGVTYLNVSKSCVEIDFEIWTPLVCNVILTMRHLYRKKVLETGIKFEFIWVFSIFEWKFFFNKVLNISTIILYALILLKINKLRCSTVHIFHLRSWTY